MSKRNASPSAFGWDFQVNAAIVLMLDNIEQAKAVRVEGETEDIEIFMSNGKKIYSQVKSVVKSSSDFSKVKEKMQDALASLADAYANGDSEQLIYITNSPNPFNDKTTMNMFHGLAVRDFDSLPDKCKNKILAMLKKIGQDEIFATSQLIIRTIPFETDNLEERYKEIKQKIDDFVYSVIPSSSGIGKEIMGIWQKDLFHNATLQNTKYVISKKEMIWSIIVLITDIEKNESEFMDDIDECDYNEIVHMYKELINSYTERFDFATKVITDYTNYTYEGLRKDKLSNFVLTNWRSYISEFEYMNDDELTEQLIKIILYNILKQQRTISNIKKRVNL